MIRARVRWLIAFAALLTMLSAGGVVLAGSGGMLGADLDALVPSAAPSLLAPISEDGRVGWSCTAERAARARSPRDAELPGAER
jgi:hypothetical protein